MDMDFYGYGNSVAYSCHELQWLFFCYDVKVMTPHSLFMTYGTWIAFSRSLPLALPIVYLVWSRHDKECKQSGLWLGINVLLSCQYVSWIMVNVFWSWHYIDWLKAITIMTWYCNCLTNQSHETVNIVWSWH